MYVDSVVGFFFEQVELLVFGFGMSCVVGCGLVVQQWCFVLYELFDDDQQWVQGQVLVVLDDVLEDGVDEQYGVVDVGDVVLQLDCYCCVDDDVDYYYVQCCVQCYQQ